MHKTSPQRWQINELLLPVSVLLILVCYTYGVLFMVPYSGFNFNNNNGRIAEIYSDQTPSLQLDDVLIKIGPVSWENYKKDARVLFFEGVQEGDIVEITVRRNGAEIIIPWKFKGFDQDAFNSRFFNIWWLAFIFWFFGTAAQLLIRPKDGLRRLFIAANYLTALWLIFGILSHSHLWESSILLHATTWLMLPVYLHLHWVFPRPLKELPKMVWIVAYLTGFAFAAAEIIQVFPKSLYIFGFLATLLGSIILEAVHYIRQKDQRRDVLLITSSIFIAFIPSIIFGIILVTDVFLQIGPLALLALPIMPLAYFYVIYRRQSGGLEVRLNRFISLYSFLILFGAVLSMLIVPISNLDISLETAVFLGILAIPVTAGVAITTFPVFQAFVEKRFLGITLPYQNLQETYSNHIAANTSIKELLQLLDGEIFPSLLVHQFAFMQVFNGKLKTLLVKNVPPGQMPHENDMLKLAALAGTYPPYD
ncbi:MAG: hypothetical protein IH588_05515, partial [Anaerolineales bacterium]|nr:hypothetical protein [Anaerolineales bacterium]